MAFPSVAARTSYGSASALTSHPLSLGSPSAGELLVVVISTPPQVGNLAANYNIDYGASGYKWFEVGSLLQGTTIRAIVLAKIAEGSDALTLGLPVASRLASLCYRITGHGSSVAVSSLSGGSGANADPPSVSQSGSAQDTLFLAGFVGTGVNATGAPSGYATLTTANSSTAACLALAEKTANATSDDPGTFTNSSTTRIVFSLAIASTAITTNARFSQVGVESASQVSPNMVVSQIAVEMVSTNVPDGVSFIPAPQVVIIG